MPGDLSLDAINQAQLGIPLPAAWATPGVVIAAEFIMTYLLMTSIFGCRRFFAERSVLRRHLTRNVF